MKNSKFTKGFTLIELLVVVAIIGILAAIVYAPLQTALRKGRDAKKISEMKSIQSSLMMYADSNDGNYPLSLDILNTFVQGGIPKNYNKTTAFRANEYNYTVYNDSAGNPRGYHLYVHLETKSPALDGAARCYSTSATYNTTACYITSSTAQASTVDVVEPGNGTGVGQASFTDRSQDSDTNCAGNTALCIYDIRG